VRYEDPASHCHTSERSNAGSMTYTLSLHPATPALSSSQYFLYNSSHLFSLRQIIAPNKPALNHSATMRPSHSIDFRPTDIKEKKLAILSIISFNNAYGVPFSRINLSEYFGINERTVRTWCAAAASNAPADSATEPAQQPGHASKNTGTRGIKRSHSEDAIAELLSSTVKSGDQKSSAGSRQNAVRNSAQGQKKRKVKEEAVTSSPPPPQQLLTPPRRNISQPRQRRRRESTEASFDFGMENSDEYVDA
jgi:hypothetical protein